VGCIDTSIDIQFFYFSADSSLYEQIKTNEASTTKRRNASEAPYLNAHMERPAHTYVNEDVIIARHY